METRDMAEVVETFRRKLMEGVAGTADRVAGACAGLVASPGGMAPHDMELELERLVGGVLDSLSAAALTTAAAAPDDSGMAAASRPEPVANGRRATSVQFLHGHSIRLKCRHFAVRRRRRRGKGRSRRGAGEWPAPDRLGIVADASPALCGAVTRACLSETCDSAVRTLACRGIGMSVTRAQRISRAIGSRGLGLRDRRLAAAATAAEAQRVLREDAVPAPAGLWGDLAGTDIAVAIDGGRMNIRTARPGRVAADRSRHGHRTDWREPRLHIIYEVGRGGRLPRGGRRLAGGALGSPDGLAALPAADLRRVGVASARRVTLLGDGAVRIRGRVDAIAEAAGIPAGKCARCLDFCHAIRHPAAFAEHAGFRDTCERVRWLDGMRRLMMTGTADAVIGAVSERIGGRRLGRESRRGCETELRYFERNRDGLTHALSRAQGLPIGSGSIGSLVRRVASLRLKGSGMFWKRENAEAFIHMRCMLKSGNWNTLCEEIWGRGKVCA